VTILASILMIVMGFVVYYVIPYSFTFRNLPLFFTILILILLGNFLLLLQNLLARFSVFCFFELENSVFFFFGFFQKKLSIGGKFFSFFFFPFFFVKLFLGMLFGLSLTATTIQPYFETFVVYFIIWGNDRISLTGVRKKKIFFPVFLRIFWCLFLRIFSSFFFENFFHFFVCFF